MALDTDITLRNQTLYCIFLRNFTEEGTMTAAEKELDRIKALGTDIVWLMPIHPLGVKARKGSLGSPYANMDYRAVNPEFGTLEDFIHLCGAIHDRGMKVIIDVVYNHTSPDSVLAKEHPEWFYHKEDGSFGNHFGDWSDIIDLDYDQPGLWRYQIDTLKYWAQWVDGFRCDVAPIVPLAFWEQARREVSEIRPGCIWLSESSDPRFHLYVRSAGRVSHSDAEEYQVFDMCYEYDIYHTWLDALTSDAALASYAEKLNLQESSFPANYVKLRYLENHDRSRAAFLIPDARARRSWTAFNAVKKGTMMIYNGQERSAVHKPSLFDTDKVDWSGEDISPLLTRLSEIRRDPVFTNGIFTCSVREGGILYTETLWQGEKICGVFPVRGQAAPVQVPLTEGIYEDMITGKAFRVEEGRLSCTGEPLIFRARGEAHFI